MNSRQLLNWYFSPTVDAYRMSEHDAEMIARLICLHYGNASHGLEKLLADEQVDIQVPPVADGDYASDPVLQPVLQIRDALASIPERKYIRHFLLHGSLATLDHVPGWSDLDTWVVIENCVLEDPAILVGLRSLFTRLNQHLLEVDPIAHHGFIVVLASSLKAYDGTAMPVPVLRRAKRLMGNGNLRLRTVVPTRDPVNGFQTMKRCFEEFAVTGIFRHHPWKGEYLTRELLRADEGMYQLKYLIGYVLSIPSLYWNALGRPVYKSESFSPFLEKFPESRNLLEAFSTIRKEWSAKQPRPYVPNRIPDWLVSRLPEDFVSQAVMILGKVIRSVKNHHGVPARTKTINH